MENEKGKYVGFEYNNGSFISYSNYYGDYKLNLKDFKEYYEGYNSYCYFNITGVNTQNKGYYITATYGNEKRILRIPLSTASFYLYELCVMNNNNVINTIRISIE
jgi:hypothetical protein